jgi:hypothetical protein
MAEKVEFMRFGNPLPYMWDTPEGLPGGTRRRDPTVKSHQLVK